MRWLTLIAVLAACGPDDGDPIDPCHECGPGAIRAGRFVEGTVYELGGLDANRNGALARGDRDQLVWLASDFSIASTQSFMQAPGTSKVTRVSASLFDSGDALASVSSEDDFSTYTSLIALASDHHQRWRFELGLVETFQVAADADTVILTGDHFNAPDNSIVSSGDIIALDGGDASLRWRRRLPQPDNLLGILIAPGGEVLVGGEIRNSLDFGGTVGVIEAKGSVDSFVAALDPATGETRWVTQFSVDRFVASHIGRFTVGPAGEIAAIVGWQTTIGNDAGTAAGSLTVGALTVGPQATLSRAIVLLSPSGEPQWLQPSEDFYALVTDGTRVFGAALGVLSRMSATGVDWRRSLTGDGIHAPDLAQLAGDRLLGTIESTPGSNDVFGPVVDGDVTISGEGMAYVDIVP